VVVPILRGDGIVRVAGDKETVGPQNLPQPSVSLQTNLPYVVLDIRANNQLQPTKHRQRRQSMLRAEAIMTQELVTVRPEVCIKEAIELLLKRSISGLPVVDHLGHLVGVITEFAMLAMVYDHEVQNQTVGQHMTREVITVDAEDSISQIADLCIIHRVRRLPVMRDGKLVGLIARRDVLQALYENAAYATVS